MQIDSAQLELLHGVVALLLPDGILDHFEIVKLDENDAPAPADGSYTPYKCEVHLYLLTWGQTPCEHMGTDPV